MNIQPTHTAPTDAHMVVLGEEIGSRAPVRHPWDTFYPITITTAEARRGTTRKLFFYQADGELITLPINIPAGLGSGTLLTIAGAGGVDPWGRTRGDLLIPVHMVPEQRLEWWGNDARLFVKITRQELQDGKHVLVDDPILGSFTFTVAPDSPDGTRLHWKGRGRGKPAGDLHVQLECLDPAPAIVAAASTPAPTEKPWLWAALILLVAVMGVAGLALGALMLLAR